MKYTFTLNVRDTPGVLMRVAQVFGRRGCNIRSLHVQPSKENEPWSTMVISVHNVSHAKQLQLQLEKLVDVQSVTVHEQESTGKA